MVHVVMSIGVEPTWVVFDWKVMETCSLAFGEEGVNEDSI